MLERALPFLFATALCAQQEIWVEPALGSDSNPGSYTQPLRTLGAALTAAGATAQIFLRSGTYSTATNGEQFPITIGAQPQTGLVIRGVGAAVFDLATGGSTVFRVVQGATGARITNLTIRNSAQTDPAGNNWWVRVFSSGSGINSADAAMGVEIDRCRFLDVNRAFVLWTSDNVTGWLVHDNLFVNCANDAILEYSGSNDFYNNTFHTGGFKAYISDSGTSRCHNNLIVGYAIAFENNNAGNPPISRYQGNWMYQCGIIQQGAGVSATLPVSNVVGVDPMLVNPAMGDYHLQTASPAVDAGVLGTFARADLDANSRIVDGDNDGVLETDVGCYEVTPFSVSSMWDAVAQLQWVDAQSSVPGSIGIVAFSLDDGLIQLPGQGPILIDLATFIPVLWVSGMPGQLVFAINPPPPPGTRLVMQVLGLIPGQVGSAFLGGNQHWQQF